MTPERACRRDYFTQKRDNLALTNVVTAVIDEEAQTLTLEFPYPFQLFGFARTQDFTTTPPSTEVPMAEDWIILSSAVNNTNAPWLQQLFIAMMYANRDVDDYSVSPFLGAVQYSENKWGKFNNYFWNYMNPEIKPVYQNSFLAAPSIIKRFWTDEAAVADVYQLTQRMPRIQSMFERLFTQTDRRLWGAPGLYTVNYGAGTPSGDGELFVTVPSVVGS